MTSILIIEDDYAQAEALKLQLVACGYLIAGIVGEGALAVAQAQALAPDVVLMNIVLPGNMDGIEAAQRISESCDIPVLYLTADADDEFFLRAKVTEPYAYLLKPCTSREIQLTIETALFRHKSERTARTLLEKKVIERTADFKHAEEDLHISIAALQATRQRTEHSESRYKTLIEQAADAFFVFDLDGHFVEVNQQACDSLGYSSEELLQMCIADIAPNYDLAKACFRWLTYEIGKRYSVTASHRRKDGSIFPVDIHLAVLQVDDKKLLMAVARDITERQQALSAVQESRLKLQQAQAIAHLGSWDYHLTTGKLSWSEELYRIYGVTPETFIPNVESFIKLIHPGDQATVQAWITSWDSGQKPKTLEFRCVWPDGTVHYLEGQGTVLMDADGKPAYLSGTAQDVTERKQVEQRLMEAKQAEEANRLKNDFLGRMSHELRTPLNSILGFTQIMDASPDDETIGEHRDNIKTMERSGWTLLRVIQDLLNLSEIETGKVELHMENSHVHTCLNECLVLLEPLAKERMIKFNCAEDTFDDVSVWADPFRLKQILTNLLANAIKYNREGGSITVSGQYISGQLRILISDTGSGIAESELDSIFKPFSHVVERPYTIEGAGIGLSIAKQLTELMDGTIGVESFVGDGSIFWIEFPVAKIGDRIAALASAPLSQNRNSATDIRPVRLLCIEDNPDHIQFIKTIIAGMENILLMVAQTPGLGLELARTNKPDLIVLDICLPGMNGHEVFKLLQANELTRHIPVIAVSASAHPYEIEQGLRAGFRRYLTKPLNVVEFKNVIGELLKDMVS